MKKSEIKLAFADYIEETQRSYTNSEILVFLENTNSLEVFNNLFDYSQEPTNKDLEVLSNLIAEYREYFENLV